MPHDYETYFKLFSRISHAIHSGTNTGEILESIVANITDFLAAKGCIYWIVNREERSIVNMISHGFTYRSLAATDYETLTTIFDIETSTEVFIEDARNDDRIPDLERLGKQRVGSVTGFFFRISGPYTGILAVYFTGKKRVESHDKELVMALGQQGAIALQKALNYDEEMINLFRQVVEGFALALEAKDGKTHGHSLKVAELARLTAGELGLSGYEVDTIFHAGLLHDIGKIGMEDHVLERLGKLSSREMKKAMEHPVTGARIIGALPMLDGIAPLVLHHHERYNGSGYPHGIKGAEIPLGARILAVCDVFETMITGRPHLKKMSLPDALDGLKEGAGTLFDPHVIDAFFIAIEKRPDAVSPSGGVERYLKQFRQRINAMGSGKAAGMKERLSKRLSDAFPIGF